ncbi:MAG: glycosyltransferase [Pseudomonadota bacterium]
MKIKSFIVLSLSLLIIFFSYKYGYKKLLEYKFEKTLQAASKVDPAIWDEKYQNIKIKDKYKVVFISNNGGEYSYIEYFKYVAEKKGWEVKIYFHQMLGYEKEIIEFDPDFIMMTIHIDPKMSMEIASHRSKKYILELSPLEFLYSNDFINKKHPSKVVDKFNEFLGLADGVLTSAKQIYYYQNLFDKMDKPFNGLRILPLVPDMNYEITEPEYLAWMGGGIDKFRSSGKFKYFIQLLSENIPMRIYGRYRFSAYLPPHIYDGYVPDAMGLFGAIRKNGIYLLTHSAIHTESATPTLRSFEAIAAGSVVISDKHPFIIENFGDNVLYYDQTLSAEEMYNQVKAHFDWIKANPEEAKQKAARAQQIFKEKFSLDNDLERIAKMHEYILMQESEMGLSYPLAY